MLFCFLFIALYDIYKFKIKINKNLKIAKTKPSFPFCYIKCSNQTF